MNLVGFISTAVLSLTLVAAAPMYAQEQHGQDEEKAKPEEKKAQPEKSAKQEQKPAAQQEKNTKQEEKNAQQQDKNTKQEEKSAQQQQRAPQATAAGAARQWQWWWPHSRRPLQGQFWKGTHVSRQRRRLPQSPLPIRRLLVRIRLTRGPATGSTRKTFL